MAARQYSQILQVSGVAATECRVCTCLAVFPLVHLHHLGASGVHSCLLMYQMFYAPQL